MSGYILSQTPQYYNLNTGTSANSFPFNMSAGKATNYLFLAGDFANPTPLPAGQQITKVYFRSASATTVSFTNLHILMAQDVITTLTTGTFYAGPYDTVFVKDTTLTSTTGGWTCVTLRHPYVYDPAKSLIIFVGQCGYSGTGFTIYNTLTSGIRRVWSVGGCPFAPYASGDASTLNFGVDVVPAAPPVRQANQWCSNYPSLPGSGALLYHASCVLGDTLYVVGGDGTGLPSTTMYKYAISSNTWTTGASMPGAKCGGDLCAANGKIYYIGGGSANNTAGTAEQYMYNRSTGAWTTIAPIPTPVTGNVAESYQDTIIYCMMGGWSSYLTTIQVYYVNSNTWTTATAFGGPGRRSFAGGIMGNNIFVACGYNGTYLSSFYRGVISPSNPLSITWTLATNNILWTASRAGGTAIAGRFYVCPGDSGSGTASNRIGIFDTSAGTWSYVAGDPFLNSNYWGIMSSSIINGGVKIWRPAGSLSATTRPLIVFADTCAIITGVGNISNKIPGNYALSQNYPNPFNPITKISYDIPKSGLVTIKIYDILGKEIATLVNENKNPGKYIVDFDGSAISSGVYFYRLESNGFVATKKMMLIK
jgi:hypothetical protein